MLLGKKRQRTGQYERNLYCRCNLISAEDLLEYSHGDLDESPVALCTALALSAVYLLLFASLTGTRVHTDAAACTVGSIKNPTEDERIKKKKV